MGEVAGVLGSHPAVKQAAACLKAGRLVGYWVGDREISTSELRLHLQARLPEHMIPDALVRLDQLPLTRSGKINLRALPEPEEITQSTLFMPPRDEVEFTVARLWQEELGLTELGVKDNFFERGGHSLKAVSLLSRLHAEFRIKLPLRTLFDYQTVEGLSQIVRKQRIQQTPELEARVEHVVHFQEGNKANLPLFLIHPHGGTVFCYQALVAALGRDLPIFGIQCRGLEEGERPLSSFEEMAADYIGEIRRWQPEGPYQVAGWSMGGLVAYETARQLEAMGQEVALLGIFDSMTPDRSNYQALLPEGARWEDFDPNMSVAEFARWFFNADARQFEGLTEEQSLDALNEILQQAKYSPPGVTRAMLRRVIAMTISHSTAMFQYSPPSRVKTDVVLFRPTESAVKNPENWALWTEGSVKTVPVPGTHHEMVFPPAVQELAAAVKQRLVGAARKMGHTPG
jgi:thioesterase domain-containing protein/acyl carrier protein